jgi:hypothetical protein
MLSNSEKFVLNKICFDMLSVFWSLNKKQINNNNLSIVRQVIFINILVEVNKFLNETLANNIDEAINEWDTLLPEKYNVAYTNTLNDLTRVNNLPENDIEIKKLLGTKVLYKLISFPLYAKICLIPDYTKNPQLSQSVKFFELVKTTLQVINNNPKLELLELIKFVEKNVDKIVDELIEIIINNLNNGVEYPKNLDGYI